MLDKVMEFLVASGAGSFDELLLRLPDDPDNIADSLANLAEKQYVKSAGPKTIADFRELVHQLVRANPNGRRDGTRLRGRVLEEIAQRQPEFIKTIIRPTTKGLTFAFR